MSAVVDYDLHQEGEQLKCIYATEDAQVGLEVEVRLKGALKSVFLTVPAAGFVIFE